MQTQVLRMFLVYSFIQALAAMCLRLIQYNFLQIKDYEKIHRNNIFSLFVKWLTREKENKQIGKDESRQTDMNISILANITQSNDMPDWDLFSALGLFTPEVHGEDVEELKK